MPDTLGELSSSDDNSERVMATDSSDPEEGSWDIVANWDLAWFAMVMGWGGTALVINGFPDVDGDFQRTLNIVGTVIWVWDFMLCLIYTVMLLLRIVLYPPGFWRMARQPGKFLFFGCVPMGVAVVTMGFIPFGPNLMPEASAVYSAKVGFWIDVWLCFASMIIPLWLMITTHEYTPQTMPSLWLLPFVSCVVCSALAGVVGDHMLTNNEKLHVNIFGYLLWGAGVITAAAIIPTYLARLIFYGLPPAAAGNSVWIVLGPIGQGANAIMMLGRNTGALQCRGVLCAQATCEDRVCPLGFNTTTCECTSVPIPKTPLASFGFIAPGITLFLGLLMWGFGIFWMQLAACASLYHTRIFNTVVARCCGKQACDSAWSTEGKAMPFNLGWWGVVFPFVTLIMSTYQLCTGTNNFWLFKWTGRSFACALTCTSVYIHVATIRHALRPSFWLKFKSG